MSLGKLARSRHHRYCIVLTGPPAWGRPAARKLLLSASANQTLWIGSGAPEGVQSIASRDFHQVLGAEFDTLVYDAHAGFDPDAFGAVTGTLRGGGLLSLPQAVRCSSAAFLVSRGTPCPSA